MDKIEILRTIDIYPGKNNGYQCNVTYKNGETREQLLHKAQVELHNYLNEMKTKLNPIEFRKLETAIFSYGTYMYDMAADQAAMDAAGGDL
jgi:hypothetical protein